MINRLWQKGIKSTNLRINQQIRLEVTKIMKEQNWSLYVWMHIAFKIKQMKRKHKQKKCMIWKQLQKEAAGWHSLDLHIGGYLAFWKDTRASKRWWCDVSTINNKISSDTWNVEAVFIEMRNYKESFMEMVCKHPNSTVTTY